MSSNSSALLPHQQAQLQAVQDKYRNWFTLIRNRYNADCDTVMRSRLSNVIKRNKLATLKQRFDQSIAQLQTSYKTESDALLAKFQAEAAAQKQPTKRALLIGINYLNSPANRLDGCINDAQQIRQFLLTQLGFQEANIRMLTDNTTPLLPTRQIILEQFRAFVRESVPGDQLFFAYSGHGSQVRDTSADERDGKDETIFALDGRNVTDDEFKAILDQEMKDGVTLLALFDSCHSGSMLDLKWTHLDSNTANESTTQQAAAKECRGTVLCLTGCTDAQLSQEAWNGSAVQGAMTLSFLLTLRDQFASKALTWRALVKQMRQLLQENGFVQQPQFSSDGPFDLDSLVQL